MKKIPLHRSKRWLTGAAAGLATWSGGQPLFALPWVDVSGGVQRAATLDRYVGGYEHVLGTSMDLIIEAPRASDAAACEAELLREIERLRRILSTYDPASDIRRAMAGETVSSAELAELLAAYDTWGARTGGLIDRNLGGVIAVWREAASTSRLPSRGALAEAARHARAYNVDALGKGFIIDRAVAVARRFAPGGLLNLGGDIRAWGDTAWAIHVADPRQPADNAPPLAHFTLREAAIATSGGYARYFQVGGRRFSHLIDPRTQWPLPAGGSASIVAPDCVTANALSTAAAILGPVRGGELARGQGAAGWLLADGAGRVVRGGSLATASLLAATTTAPATLTPLSEPTLPTPTPAPGAAESTPPATSPAPAPTAPEPAPTAPAASAPWTAGFLVNLQITLKKFPTPPTVYRPYVAVWIENEQGEVVRNLAVWGTDSRWQGKLTMWRYQNRDQREFAAGGARATRAPGTHSVIWDGKDDARRQLSAGTYKFCVEICREDGHHIAEAVTLTLGTEPLTATIKETAESAESTLTYGPQKP